MQTIEIKLVDEVVEKAMTGLKEVTVQVSRGVITEREYLDKSLDIHDELGKKLVAIFLK